MRYHGPESEHPKPTRFYNYWVLFALSEVSGPLHLEAIYRRVRAHLEKSNLLREGDDLEYWIRWALSNAQKKEHVKNTASGSGVWEITEKGRHSLAVPIDDDDDIYSDV